jgi:hypothetical protein
VCIPAISINVDGLDSMRIVAQWCSRSANHHRGFEKIEIIRAPSA